MKHIHSIIFIICISLSCAQIQSAQPSAAISPTAEPQQQKTWWQRYKTKIFTGVTILAGVGLAAATIISNTSKNKSYDLLKAITENQPKKVESILAQGVSIDNVSPIYNILELAILQFNQAIYQNIDYSDITQPTINVTAQLLNNLNNSEEIIRMLILHGAQPKQQGKAFAVTPLEKVKEYKERTLHLNSQVINNQWDKLIQILEPKKSIENVY